MKVYTKKGDSGETSLLKGRCSKTDFRIVVMGKIDSLNAYLYHYIELIDNEKFSLVKNQLREIINILNFVMIDLVNNKDNNMYFDFSSVEKLENYIDNYDLSLPKLEKFILFEGSKLITFGNILRTKTREIEIEIINLNKFYKNQFLKCAIFINRLSDYFFTLIRYFYYALEVEEKVVQFNK